MYAARLNGTNIHYHDLGPKDGPVLMFSNSLGTDFRIWDRLLAALPAGLRIIRYDKRGHGLSELHPAPYFMGDLVGDAIALMDHLEVKDVNFVGLSIGGLIAQGVAAERPDLLRSMVLCDTAAKIGTPDMWQTRVDALRKDGLHAMSDAILERWFSAAARDKMGSELEIWRAMITRGPLEGYIGCCQAIAETDLFESTSGLTLPTMVVVGRDDGATPPDLVRETAGLISGAEFHIIANAGHLPCVDQPEALSKLIVAFLNKQNIL